MDLDARNSNSRGITPGQAIKAIERKTAGRLKAVSPGQARSGGKKKEGKENEVEGRTSFLKRCRSKLVRNYLIAKLVFPRPGSGAKKSRTLFTNSVAAFVPHRS